MHTFPRPNYANSHHVSGPVLGSSASAAIAIGAQASYLTASGLACAAT